MNKHVMKKVPHYNLLKVKELISNKQYQITRIAVNNALSDFGLYPSEIIEEILDLNITHFYKSMTSNNNNKLWQDVYHKDVETADGEIIKAYIKLQIDKEKGIIIQFKNKDEV